MYIILITDLKILLCYNIIFCVKYVWIGFRFGFFKEFFMLILNEMLFISIALRVIEDNL